MINHAAQQVETLVKSRDALLASQKSLLANVSHALRSRLTRVRMGLEFIASTSDASANRAKDEIARPRVVFCRINFIKRRSQQRYHC